MRRAPRPHACARRSRDGWAGGADQAVTADELGEPLLVPSTTLRTTTEVVGRRAASGQRGIVVLRVRTVDERGEGVLDFHRAPLLPAREEGSDASDDLAAFGADVEVAVPPWDLAPLRGEALGPLLADLRDGDTIEVEAGETVTAAPELARLSLNMAYTHTDASQGAHGQRLVYGGHVIGIAAAHVTRALPDLATILALGVLRPPRPHVRGQPAALARRTHAPRPAASPHRSAEDAGQLGAEVIRF